MTLLNHPKGLRYLFFTEMWERFSYYGMRAILVLYCVAETENSPFGGLGWSKGDALYLYAIYTALVYLLSIPGGLIADRLLGNKKSIMVGGFLLIAGHISMSIKSYEFFYLALALIILGTGMLKPNISSMVGQLYGPKDKRRDAGFIIFYMGINLGAFLSSLIVSEVADIWGWHYGFGLAAIGMAFGQIVFIRGQETLKNVGNLMVKSKTKKVDTDFAPLNLEEKDRLKLVFISFFIVWLFFSAFEQAGGLMNIYTSTSVDRTISFSGKSFEIAAGSFQATNSMFILLFGSSFVVFLNYLNKNNIRFTAIRKFGYATIITSIGFIALIISIFEGFKGDLSIPFNNFDAEQLVKSNMTWIILAYMFHTIGELFISPISLSFVTKLSPKRYTSSMMGFYFAVTGLGNLAAGMLGAQSEKLGNLNIFIIVAFFLILFGSILIAFEKKLIKLSHGLE